MANIIKKYELIFCEVGENKNKFWRGILYDDGTGASEYGRVGYDSQTCEYPSHSIVESKMRSKIKKGYTELKTVSAATASSGSCSPIKSNELHTIAKSQLLKTSNPTLERLIKRFVDANVHKITSSTQITYNSTTGLFATPLGIVEQTGLDEARNLLADLAPIIRDRKFGMDADHILSKYLRIIPQSLGMKRFSTETVIPDDNALQRQLDLIDSLQSSYQALQTAIPTTSITPTAAQEQVFKVDLDVLTDQSERNRLDRYFETSKKRMHGYDNVHVKEIFKVNIHDMTNNFKSCDSSIVETFHGSSMANCLSILKCGLKISPPSTAKIAGKLFGNGLYGAVNSTKSIGYCLDRWGQGGVGDAAFLFICSFAMGRTYSTTTYGCSKPSGYDSVWAKASANGLKNDELIVYSEDRIKVNYLLECK